MSNDISFRKIMANFNGVAAATQKRNKKARNANSATTVLQTVLFNFPTHNSRAKQSIAIISRQTVTLWEKLQNHKSVNNR